MDDLRKNVMGGQQAGDHHGTHLTYIGSLGACLLRYWPGIGFCRSITHQESNPKKKNHGWLKV